MCMSKKDPVAYYFDSAVFQCFRCPTNCTCNSEGCVSCSESTNRTVRIFDDNKMICTCNGILNDIDGICECYEGCTC